VNLHTEADMRRHYVEVRKRLGALPPRNVVIPKARRNAKALYATLYDAPIGPIRVVYSEIALPSQAFDKPMSSAQRVIDTIAREHGFSYAEITGRSRRSVRVRAICAHRLRSLGLSLPQIGRVMGGRDHTSILYLCNTFTPTGERADG